MPDVRTRRRTVAALAAVAGALGAALVPATGSAALITFGSDLAAPANVVQQRGADTAFWQVGFADARSPVAPASGQITSVRIKGVALSDRVTGVSPPGGERDFHVQVAEPLAGGAVRVRNPGGTSGGFVLPPSTADPQGITQYLPENLCARAGDVLIFNTVGGHDPAGGPFVEGTPLQIFSRVPNAVASGFMAPNMTNNGNVLTQDTSRTAGLELLMQMTLGTGPDGTGLCPGGTRGGTPATPPPPPGTTPRPPAVQRARIGTQRVTVSRRGTLGVSLYCSAGPSRCIGSVRVLTRGARPVSLGSARFDIAARRTGRATIALNATGRRRFARSRGRLAVKLVADTRPGGASRRSTYLVTLRRR